MTPFSIRSLLLAAIFICNCITWTSTKHHYTHNINGHRSRHRRQGAGLFLSGSHVLPGGEGSGWGDWGEVTPCSRTCGGGVASQKRICLQIRPEDGQPLCTGGDTKYFSCQTQDCPAGSTDFRAEQCSEFDELLYNGIKYKWVPYLKVSNPCELNCMPQLERFYYKHRAKVVDGTRCNDESFDVCVNGTCQPVGCDMMLGSSAKEDKCRECRGNNANCHTVSELLDTPGQSKGYNDILLIPEGATSIAIAEVAKSNNYLAIRAKNGTYYLNGNYHINFPRNLYIAGAMWTYERSQHGFPAPDKLRSLGPTNEPLYLSLLLQEENVGIEYEYSVPSDKALLRSRQYNWVHDEFTPCSAPCGGGNQTRNVTCRSREELEQVDEILCDEGMRPITEQSCNTDPCEAQWETGPWGECSQRCGEGGYRTREISCQQIIANGYPSIVAEKECLGYAPKPIKHESCNENATCPTWFIGEWKACDKLCDEGKQTRQVVCHQRNGRRIEVLDDNDCPDKRPADEKPCMLKSCSGVDWVTSHWIGCDSCLSTHRTRTVECATTSHQVLDDKFCALHAPPHSQEECTNKLPECEVQWYASQWSKCSVTCGQGVKTRNVFCGVFEKGSVEQVEDSRCANLTKYNDTTTCEIPKEQCPSQWFTGPWTACAPTCERYRRVMCLRDGVQVLDCPEESAPEPVESCNKDICNEDGADLILESTPEYDEDCDDEEEDAKKLYAEAGLDDADVTTTTAEDHLSDNTTTEGSGMSTTVTDLDFSSLESTMITEELITTDGSGTGSSETVSDDDLDDTTLTPSIDDTDTTGTGTPLTDATTEPSGTDHTGTSTPLTDATTEPTGAASPLTDETAEPSGTDTTGTGTPLTDATTEPSGTDHTGTSTPLTDATTEPTGTDTTGTATPLTDATNVPSGTSPTDVTTKRPAFVPDDDGELPLPSDSVELGLTSTLDPHTTTELSESVTPTDITTNENGPLTTPEGSTTVETERFSTTEGSTQTETESSTTTEGSTTAETEPSSTSESSTTIESESPTTSDGSSTTEIEPSSTSESNTRTETVSPTTAESSTINETEFLTTTEGSTQSETESSTTTEGSTTTETEPSSTSESSTTIGTEALTTSDGSSTTETKPSSTSDSNTRTETELPTTAEGSTTDQMESLTTAEGSTTTETEPLTTSEPTTGTNNTTEDESLATTGTSDTTENEFLSTTSITQITESLATTEPSNVSESESLPTSTGNTESIPTTEAVTTDPSLATNDVTEATSTLSPETDPWSTSWAEWTTTEDEELSSTLDWLTTKKPRMCRPKKKSCYRTTFGCCPDSKTAASGPFEEGCDHHETCDKTTHRCCSDGVSPALGPKDEGCPHPPCNTTLYGCCLSDNSTAAQGNDQEDCPPPPPPPPACLSSQFGCCADNETEAPGPENKGCPETTEPPTEPPSTTTETEVYSTTETESEAFTTTSAYGCDVSDFGCCFDNVTNATGPNEAGCPCQVSEFGCCPDDVSPAKGPKSEGCEKDNGCNSAVCCPDGKTPAHGPNQEGCCIHSPFGCCPDNINFARGLQQEGCECINSPYGCCPDNKTSASGYNNKGCGCSFSPQGCCPDGHTEASGPNFGGCACHTYQFGCCPDGITKAKGPSKLGCDCSQSEFKCCGDGETHATGPNNEGCDCATSKYGCCPDGRSEATGRNFEGCSDKPEDRQAACGLTIERGSCHNYVIQWFFDPTYGGCSRFWYGGCDGNGNRFATKEECEDICINPPPKDTCKLPPSKGVCFDYNLRWHYDTQSATCTNFVYGGCLGNKNNFVSRELCQKQCEPEKTTEQCSLPIERGSCAGNFSRWGFNKESCEEFSWGGCEGNHNRFTTEVACNERCNPPGKLKPKCTQPQEAGTCDGLEAVWSFSGEDNRCEPFYYTGCGGNENRFNSLEACEESCPSVYEVEKCKLPYDSGSCANYRERWYFDTQYQRCRQFYFGGCDGNANNFPTEQQCRSECQAEPTTTTTTTTTTPQPETTQDLCELQPEPGNCASRLEQWYFEKSMGECYEFIFSGCDGNDNRFNSREDCERRCKPEPEPTLSREQVCAQPADTGNCSSRIRQWYYEEHWGECYEFVWSGCGGNDNRFNSREDCERRCKLPPVTTTTTQAPVPAPEDECSTPLSLAPCGDYQTSFYFDETTSSCREAPIGGCGYHNSYYSEEACERQCGTFKDIDVCGVEQDRGQCSGDITKFYYDAATRSCLEFMYGGCLGGANRFSTVEECNHICNNNAEPDRCALQPEPGSCKDRFEQWYYDARVDECQRFAYSGCGGNDNRFSSREDCERGCKPSSSAHTTTTTPAPVPEPQDECNTPLSLAPCGDYQTSFYFDEASSSCREAPIAGCGYRNSYYSEEACERQCGAFKDINVCRAEMDPGPGREIIPKFYFNTANGSCSQFTYGGDLGGANRFSTLDECNDVCKGQAPAPACLQAVAVGESCDATPARRWHYDPLFAECFAFAYRGCGGNRNNFVSYDHCATLCNVSPPEICTEYIEECDTLERSCGHGVDKALDSNGCQRCSCRQEDRCEEQRRACDDLRCQFGTRQATGDDGCVRCQCVEDPCDRCLLDEKCETYTYIDPETNVEQYAANCIPENPDWNDILPPQSECAQFERECDQLSCPNGVDRTKTARGCERCSCLPEADCTLLQRECDILQCGTYGKKTTYDEQGCQKCSCKDACDGVKCGPGQFCKLVYYRDVIDGTAIMPECTSDNKPGTCPTDSSHGTESAGVTDCKDDSDCRGRSKCCAVGSTRQCQLPLHTTAPPVHEHIANRPAPPSPSEDTEPQVAATEGGLATLRCIFHGNPPPKITWRFGEITIDGDRDRYRLTSDGALEIVSIFRNDSGVYVCVADNGLGTSQQEIQLIVNVPVETQLRVASSPVSAGRELSLQCDVDGYPMPSVTWTKDGVQLAPTETMWLTDSRLTIPRSSVADSGEYGCHAANQYTSDSAKVQVTVQEVAIPSTCTDSPYFADCNLIVQSRFCTHVYYKKFCCKSCVEAGQLDPNNMMQADEAYRKK